MTLQETLRDYDWIPDPSNEDRIRIAGPDASVTVIVESDDGADKLRCWLWRPKTGERVEGVLLTVDELDGLVDAIDELYAMREFLGDCQRCGTPMELSKDGQPICLSCGQVTVN